MAEQAEDLSAYVPSTNIMAESDPSQHAGSKRKADFDDEQPNRHGKGRRGDTRRGSQKNKRNHKSKDMGRGAYFRSNPDKRRKVDDSRDKSVQRAGASASASANANGEQKPAPIYVTKFTEDEIAEQDRRPKRKVAVMIGYSGTGYKGMQIMPNQRTIEGDLFQAFVKAGAISKANADDPKKSQLVRCARTDKGVHAAGNVISLKLIVEDADIVERINSHLPEQIRVWGYERTTGSFSSYGLCDSRWYEYLIPTYCFLPPHPSTWMAKELENIAKEDGKEEEYKERQKEVLEFWEKVENEQIKPLLEAMDDETRTLVENAVYNVSSVGAEALEDAEDEADMDDNADIVVSSADAVKNDGATPAVAAVGTRPIEEAEMTALEGEGLLARVKDREKLDAAIKSIKNAYLQAKNAYRMQPERIARVKDILRKYEGTNNFHNFTIKKSPRDASAKRHIRSVHVNGDPVLINGTEWLSIKLHGQSFMMHQIRKMVAMAALIVRSGCDPERIPQVLGQDVINIPKAPGLGLLLERPVFETYNQRANGFDRNPIVFDKYEKEMLEFKQREIYDKIFQEEAANHVFHTFFAQIENFREPNFLYLSSRGLAAVKSSRTVSRRPELSRSQKAQQRSSRREAIESQREKAAQAADEQGDFAAAASMKAGNGGVAQPEPANVIASG